MIISKKIVQDIIRIKKNKSEGFFNRKINSDQNIFKDKNILESSDVSTNFSGKMHTKKTIVRAVALLVIVAIVVFWGGTWLLESANIKVLTTKRDINLDDVMLATLGETENQNIVKFTTMKIIEKDSLVIPLMEAKKVEKRAGGELVLFNEFSNKPQTLIARTRLESPTGKIYRLVKAVTIPGFVVKNGKITPGSVAAEVLADEVGQDYNFTEPAILKVVGFRGLGKYSKIYANAKNGLRGGFKGEVKTASNEVLDSAIAALKEKIENKLRKKALAEMPPGYLSYEDASFFSLKDNRNEIYENTGDASDFDLTAEGELLVYIVKQDDMEEIIARKKISDFQSANISIPRIDKFAFSLIGKRIINPSNLVNFSFRLTGTSSIFWDFDDNLLKERLSGIDKGDYQMIFKDFPTIEKAEVVLKPFWLRSFPEDTKRIKIEKINN